MLQNKQYIGLLAICGTITVPPILASRKCSLQPNLEENRASKMACWQSGCSTIQRVRTRRWSSIGVDAALAGYWLPMNILYLVYACRHRQGLNRLQRQSQSPESWVSLVHAGFWSVEVLIKPYSKFWLLALETTSVLWGKDESGSLIVVLGRNIVNPSGSFRFFVCFESGAHWE